MDKPTLLLIDDDQSEIMGYYETFLSRVFHVKRCSDPDEALRYATVNASSIRGVILDIMMPYTGTALLAQETDDGLETGVPLFARLRTLLGPTPIIVLTNVNPDLLASKLPGLPAHHLLRKMEYNPLELTRFLETVIILGSSNPKDRGDSRAGGQSPTPRL
jgi:CheY-like chemotaxis protein